MRKIWKYAIGEQGVTELRMPSGSKILSIAYQNADLCVWVMINDRNHECVRRIRVIYTGEETDLGTWLSHPIGTAQFKSVRRGYVVVHAFDMGEKNL